VDCHSKSNNYEKDKREQSSGNAPFLLLRFLNLKVRSEQRRVHSESEDDSDDGEVNGEEGYTPKLGGTEKAGVDGQQEKIPKFTARQPHTIDSGMLQESSKMALHREPEMWGINLLWNVSLPRFIVISSHP